MNNTNELNQNLCSHGIQKDKPCLFCAQEGVYFQRDAEVYAEIYIKTSNVSFELAFELDRRIKIWKEASKNLYLGDYLKAIKESKSIRWSENSLRQAYTVALEFPDLSEKSENRLCFSSYREIANAGISLEQKQEIRKIAEDEKLRFEEVRKLIKNGNKKEEVKATDDSEIKEGIVYHTDEDFVKEIKEFFQRHKDLKGGTTIILKYKNRK